ncbi:hypothetical protein BGZ63DRAFT_369590 [Mariannaea sp. PMI_226]|nr:hypothetical protein BGZ63DRAFT_369590 [Mariannaea sp. PMI_226]
MSHRILDTPGVGNVIKYLTHDDINALKTNSYGKQDWMTIGMCIKIAQTHPNERIRAIALFLDSRHMYQHEQQQLARMRQKNRQNLKSDLLTDGKETLPKPISRFKTKEGRQERRASP